jgi:hypothetical protein
VSLVKRSLLIILGTIDMVWFCGLCGVPSKLVMACKVADIHQIFVGDLCMSCLRAKAESAMGMEKMDAYGIGHTQAVLDEGALQLMKCPMCKKWRPEIIMAKPNECCASCFNYLMYSNN